MTYKPRSNALLTHVLGEQVPIAGETWRLRKGDRQIVIDEVGPGVVFAHEATSGRRTTIVIDTLTARYTRVDPQDAIA